MEQSIDPREIGKRPAVDFKEAWGRLKPCEDYGLRELNLAEIRDLQQIEPGLETSIQDIYDKTNMELKQWEKYAKQDPNSEIIKGVAKRIGAVIKSIDSKDYKTTGYYFLMEAQRKYEESLENRVKALSAVKGRTFHEQYAEQLQIESTSFCKIAALFAKAIK